MKSHEINLQPVLQGDLLTLRPLKDDDFESLFAVASDKLIWEQHPAWDRYKRDVFERFFEDAMNSKGAFIVLDNQSQKVIGSSRYHGLNLSKSEVEIGWTFLARKYWGGLYNREMKKLMLDHAFGFVETVVLLVGPQNFRSQKAVEKIGGKEAGIRTDGSGTESLLYKISRS